MAKLGSICALLLALTTGTIVAGNHADPIMKAQTARLIRNRLSSQVITHDSWMSVGGSDFNQFVNPGMGNKVEARFFYDSILNDYYLEIDDAQIIFDDISGRFTCDGLDYLRVDGSAILVPTGVKDRYAFVFLNESEGDTAWTKWYTRWLLAGKPKLEEFEIEPEFVIAGFLSKSVFVESTEI